jgi:hypothetical protein
VRGAGSAFLGLKSGLSVESDPAGSANGGGEQGGVHSCQLSDRVDPGRLESDAMVATHERHQREVVLPPPLRLAARRPPALGAMHAGLGAGLNGVVERSTETEGRPLGIGGSVPVSKSAFGAVAGHYRQPLRWMALQALEVPAVVRHL